ncbi:SCP2 sterol-binding domain-containing protein [Acinetobacter johnsonii]|jgi:putative sterol carrier protein|uniref:SCP2 sterol-binding domain-containing protein n=1 Tax=Acinetobacter johnsonii TaxID=40214 RepID=UPI0007386B79|nr:SCP2 sterol-binding domain-containing protein [Acinetobacter johnsonii]AXF44914.1 SCP-2 sterol transfer family protein [Acinetobacter johnsonii]KUG38250.1 SCP-2 sterol transfer family protein [Acinetobacter johnsonii]MDH1713335.1 SCP2 sterol-binding domain-containing protein [Acinetobacter johnsonii]UJA01898.1 SCP-2 sterol transfer family protein [Acinetobacter johnsonii]
MPAFLTDDWFSTVETLTAQAGNLNLPPALANLAINLVVTDNTCNTTELSLDGGAIKKGLSSNAKTTLNMDAETLRKVFLEFDMAAAMQAFMTGKIKVQGDMSQLMALQTAKPSQEQKDLFKKVLEQTA